MPTIGELLILSGVKLTEKFHAHTYTWSGGMFVGTPEVQPSIELSTDLGSDAREATYIHVRRPAPALTPQTTITDEDGTQWRTVADREDNPASPTVRFKVEKVVA